MGSGWPWVFYQLTKVGSLMQDPGVADSLRAPIADPIQRSVRASDFYIALLAAISILAYLLSSFVFQFGQRISDFPLLFTLAIGSPIIIWRLARQVIRLEFSADLLAGLSILTASLMGQFLAAAIIILMLSGGAALEEYITGRAGSDLRALHQRIPQIAHLRTDTGYRDISLRSLRVGDVLVILPHETAPVDALVVEGHSRMDESYLTGEPFEISKAPGSAVFSGAVNQDHPLTVRATRLPEDSRQAQIVRLLNQTASNRIRIRRLADQLAAWYTPIALVIATLVWVWSGDPLRFLAVIVIATPCPLLIGIPICILGAISLAARRGIIVKNAAIFEQIDQCRILIFDKTGTLTYGKPVLTEILCEVGFHRNDVLSKVASLERYSKHPLAAAILKAAQEVPVPLTEATEVSEAPGEGLRGIIKGTRVEITGRAKRPDLSLPQTAEGLECIVLFDGELAAILRFRDKPRAESIPFVSHLRPNHGAKRVVLLSGDRETEVRYLARAVGIEEVYFSKSPEEKVAIVKSAGLEGLTLYVGDGINDAPAMLAATVGVALGCNSDITAQAASAVILDSSLEKTDELIHIGRRMRKIALQTAVGGMALSIIGMLFAAMGHLDPIAGAVTQEVIDLGAILNATRVSFYDRRLSDFDNSSAEKREE